MGKYAISFGPGAYGGLDITNGAPLDGWCPQYALKVCSLPNPNPHPNPHPNPNPNLKDFTGLDSLVSPAFSLLLLLLFNLPCMPSGEGWTWGAARPFDAVPVEAQGLGLGLRLGSGSGSGLGLGLGLRLSLSPTPTLNLTLALRQAAEEPEEAKFNTLRGGDSVHAANTVLTEMGKVAPAPSVETAEKTPSTV